MWPSLTPNSHPTAISSQIPAPTAEISPPEDPKGSQNPSPISHRWSYPHPSKNHIQRPDRLVPHIRKRLAKSKACERERERERRLNRELRRERERERGDGEGERATGLLGETCRASREIRWYDICGSLSVFFLFLMRSFGNYLFISIIICPIGVV